MKQPTLRYADVKLNFACMQCLYVTTTISVVQGDLQLQMGELTNE